MAYRNKIYVAFDADSDIRYYNMMKAWKQSGGIDFNFHDAHEVNNIWQHSLEDTIKRRLRERMKNAKVFVLLVGENTKHLYKYVRWEVELALNMGLPIIVVNLNQQRTIDDHRLPPILRNAFSVSIKFKAAILQYALENWPNEVAGLTGKVGPRQYPVSVYSRLGI